MIAVRPCPDVITEPGCYDVPISRYHGDAGLCDGPSVSSSVIRAALDCPARAWSKWVQNPDAAPVDSDALRYGRARHAWLEGPEAFHRECVVSPHDDFKKKAAQDWRDSQTRVVLKAANVETFKAMDKGLARDEYARKLFARQTVAEPSLIWRDRDSGLWVRSRPDIVSTVPGGLYAVDYKTAQTVEPRQFSAAAFRYGYHVQAAITREAFAALGLPFVGGALVCQEKAEPYITQTYAFTAAQLDIGAAEMRAGLMAIRDGLASGKWPTYSATPMELITPKWLTQEDETDDGNRQSPDDCDPADYLAAG